MYSFLYYISLGLALGSVQSGAICVEMYWDIVNVLLRNAKFQAVSH